MNFTMLWPIVLLVASDIVYQICAKSMPTALDPFASLAVTYGIGAVVSLIMFYVLNRSGDLLQQYTHLNWTSLVLGAAIVGLEAGSIYLYRVGWNINTGMIVKNSIIAIALLIVGKLLYQEELTPSKLAGVVICMIGLYFINR